MSRAAAGAEDAGALRRSNIAFFVAHAGCPHRCSYCDQNAITGHSEAPAPAEVERTLQRVLSAQPDPARRAQTEIAFFGGSFTAVDRTYTAALLETASRFLGEGKFRGIRISTRPDCVSKEDLRFLREYGVTSIELGAQSMRDEVLRLNGRGHTARDVREASERIRRAGFSLGLQMMTGLYGDDESGARYTAGEIAALEPETVRIYPTVVLRGTRLHALMREGKYTPPNVGQSVPLCSEILSFFVLHKIRVIRLGLHAEKTVEEKLVGGAYHPALRELCESEIMLRAALCQLEGRPGGRYDASVRAADISRMIGQKRKNIRLLSEKGYIIRVRPAEGLQALEVRMNRHTEERSAFPCS